MCLLVPAVTKKNTNFFRSTAFQKSLEQWSLNLPQNCLLPGRDKVIPRIFAACDASPPPPIRWPSREGGRKIVCLTTALAVPKSGRERIQNSVECFFRVFRKSVLLQPEKAEKVTLASVYLQNCLRSGSSKTNCIPQGAFDTEHLESGTVKQSSWRSDH
jgi:hypothetical protein